LIALWALLPTIALAEVPPPKGPFDPRVRVVDYNPMNVVHLSTFYGVSTHVQFAQDESINDVAIGDDQAWKVVPRGNHLFIKPQATNADTNITVVTNKRTYQFALVVQPRPLKDATAWANPNLIFSLTFQYPDEEAAQRAAESARIKAANAAESARVNAANAVAAEAAAAERAEKASKEEIKARLANAKKEMVNTDYWVAGSDDISPTEAKDDGRFIYLTFSNNRDFPAVFAVEPNGKAALINTHVEGNTIVIQRLLPKLMLRRGDSVASVVNKAFDPNGGKDNGSGTIAPGVERIVKGAQ